MASVPAEIQERLRALQRDYAAGLPAKVDAIRVLWADYPVGTHDYERLREIHRKVHSLTGSGATFGFVRLSEIARTLEERLKRLLDTGSKVDAPEADRIEALMLQIAEAAAQPDRDDSTVPVPVRIPAPRDEDARRQLLYLVEDDAALARELGLQLENFGYEVETFEAPDAAVAAVGRRRPAAIVMDIMFPEGRDAGLEAMDRLRDSQHSPLPLVFVSARTDFDARLAAVRAGADAYVTKPVDIGRLVDELDRLTARRRPDPFRILLIDDDQALAERYALVLRSVGMLTEVVTEPREVLERLLEFRPDLVLLDLYMPECSGLELARLIRQHEAFVSLPVVFLSTEARIERQLDALMQGGDEFLTKPLSEDTLINAVFARVRRWRVLRSLMERDSLTGLLNHSRIKNQLDIEVERARRTNTELSLAMVDLDHFKSINDRYGHGTGDRVIKSLARLLQQRLRKVDLIGRYGGEEFSVVLPGADVDTARRVLEEVRAAFEAVRHRHEDTFFAVTLSAGIASYPACAGSGELLVAADRALYRAKQTGRNRVVIDGVE